MKQKGKSTLEIRKYIDNKYKEGYGKPTPTPMPKLKNEETPRFSFHSLFLNKFFQVYFPYLSHTIYNSR